MMAYFTCSINRFAMKMTILYFLTGSLLMLLLLFVKVDFLFVVALIFLSISSVINGITVFCLIMSMLLNFADIEQHTMTLVAALLNYPIAFLYIHFVF